MVETKKTETPKTKKIRIPVEESWKEVKRDFKMIKWLSRRNGWKKTGLVTVSIAILCVLVSVADFTFQAAISGIMSLFV